MHAERLETQREKQFCRPNTRTFQMGACQCVGEAGRGCRHLTHTVGERWTLGGGTPLFLPSQEKLRPGRGRAMPKCHSGVGLREGQWPQDRQG